MEKKEQNPTLVRKLKKKRKRKRYIVPKLKQALDIQEEVEYAEAEAR